MRFLLDTMVFIGAYEGDLHRMPKRVQNILTNNDEDLSLSALSLTEIAIKNSVGKLSFPLDRISKALEDLRIGIIPFENSDARAFFSLPLFADRRDPFDRMMIAQAMAEDMTMITADRLFGQYAGLRVLAA